ncbi:hypothetical protein SLEP1_g57575 [Rubroshorea leprosula]|uniref:Uncharacterized protein n=1 Tax=Rubroshorea leprosula TaxID=152421 RepID=A0AAV5MMW6_9ROSI|nr:hypothetical protein SLEP1_g57575 [Rubroshorea leprosula]
MQLYHLNAFYSIATLLRFYHWLSQCSPSVVPYFLFCTGWTILNPIPSTALLVCCCRSHLLAAAKLPKPSTCCCQTAEAICLLLYGLPKPYAVLLRPYPSWY